MSEQDNLKKPGFGEGGYTDLVVTPALKAAYQALDIKAGEVLQRTFGPKPKVARVDIEKLRAEERRRAEKTAMNDRINEERYAAAAKKVEEKQRNSCTTRLAYGCALTFLGCFACLGATIWAAQEFARHWK